MVVKINTHPIVVGAHEEYHIEWHGKIIDTHPKMMNNLPIFRIRSHEGMVELNTIDMKVIEHTAQKMTNPCGAGKIVTDRSYIYIVEEDGKEALLGIVTHSHIREYRRMFDDFEYY